MTMRSYQSLGWLIWLLATVVKAEGPLSSSQADIVLSSGVFGSNGLVFYLEFSGDTNKGGEVSSFSCNKFFTFTGNTEAECSWTSSRSVAATLTASATELVGVNSIVTVKQNTIQPLSDASSFIPVSSVTISKSPSPLVPEVFISAPKMAGVCDSPKIDVTTSTGACGRDWKSAVLVIESIPLTVTLQNHEIFPPIEIPIGMLTPNYYYDFKYTLCNFMDSCSESVHTLYASDKKTPIVVIQGQATRTIHVKDTLLLTASGYTADCDGGTSSSDVVFSWQVFADGVLDTSIVSISSDPKKFKIGEYSLTPLVNYRVVATATSKSEGTNSSTFVTVTVPQSDLVLLHSGGSQQSARLGESIVIDCSESYDSDYPADAGVTELRFEFDCALLPLTDSTSCDLTMIRLAASVRVTPKETAAVGSVHAITITMFDVGGTRNASKVVYVTADAPDAPVVSVAYSTASKINPSDSLQLLGTVESTVSNDARWVLNNFGGISLADIAQTNIVQTLPAGLSPFNLVLQPDSLIGSETPYSFSLYVDSTFSTIEVTINTPPTIGVLAITPEQGVEMDKEFKLEASRWIDSDMPLSYQFGYRNPKDDSILIVRGRAEIAFAETTLPSGGKSRNNSVDCTVKVFDSLNAYSVGEAPVTVNKLNISTQEFGKLVTDNLNAKAGDLDGTKEILSVATSVANSQDCDSLPYTCGSELHRADCFDTPNTCGPCLDGFVGTEGDDNSVCVEDFVSGDSLSGCYLDSECPSAWEFCNTTVNKCMRLEKTCNNDCSGHGTCAMFSTDSGKPFESPCLMGMTSCKAKCVCDDSFYGDTCTISDSDYSAKLSVRETLLLGLQNVALGDDKTEDSVQGWMASLNAMATSPQELSLSSSSLALDIAEFVVDSVASVDVPFSSLLDLMKALDVSSQVVAKDKLQKTNAIMDKLNDYIVSKMLEGQDAVQSVRGTLRTSTEVVGGNALSSSLPLTYAESIAGVKPSSVFIEGQEGLASFSLSSMRSQLLSLDGSSTSNSVDDGEFVSNSVRANIAAPSTQQVTFVLQNSVSQSYFEIPGAEHRTICLEGDYTHTSYVCDNAGYGQSILWHNCTGEKLIIDTPCPTVSFAPSCKILNDDAKYDCAVKNFTTTETVCLCNRTDDPSSRRRVLRTSRHLSSEALEDSGAIEVSSISLLIIDDFSTTIVSTGDLSLGDLQNAIIIFILYASLWGGGMLGLTLCTWRRRKLSKISGLVRSELMKKKAIAQSRKNCLDVKNYMLSYINEVFPAVYRSTDSMFTRAWSEISKHHKYLILFTAKGHNSENVRMLTGVYLLTMQTLLMFILAVCYDVEFPKDDGSCLTHETKESCLAPKSVFDATKSMCAWTDHDSTVVEYVDNEDIGGLGYIPSCEFVAPVFTVKVVVILSIIAALITAPLNFVIDFLFWSVISAPTADSLKMQQEDSLFTRSVREAGRRLSTVGRRMSNAGAAVASAGRRMSNAIISAPDRRKSSFSLNIETSRQLPDSAREAQILASASFSDIIDEVKTTNSRRVSARQTARQTFLSQVKEGSAPNQRKVDYQRLSSAALGSNQASVDEQFDEMVVDMMEQRSNLLPSEVAAFDREWGLVNGQLDRNSSVIFGGSCCRKTTVSRMEEVIKSEMEYVQKESHAKYSKLRLATDQQIGLEILHLFILDLLGRDTPIAKIFLSKSEEDFRHQMVLTPQVKMAAWVVVVLLNFFFIFFSMLRGIERGTEWQKLFAVACVLQFFVEIVFYETTECLIVNFVIPDLAKREVVAVGDALRSIITKVCDAKYGPSGEGLVAVDHDSPFSSPRDDALINTTGENLCLDAPNYLFVAHGVAKKFPNLLESVIVQSYHSYSPGELSRKWVKRFVRRGEDPEEAESESATQSCLMKSCPWAFNSSSSPSFNRIGLTFGLTFIVIQILIRFGASSPRLQRMVIHSLQPMAFALIVMICMFLVNNPAFFAILAILVAYKSYYWYRDHKIKEVMKGDKRNLLSQEDEYDDEDDLETGERTSTRDGVELTASNLSSIGGSRGHSQGSTSSRQVPSLSITGPDNSEDDNISLSMPRLPKLPSEVSSSGSSEDDSDDEDDGSSTEDEEEVLRRLQLRKGSTGSRRRSSANQNLAFQELETIYSNNNSVQLGEMSGELLGKDEINYDFELSDEEIRDAGSDDSDGFQIRQPSYANL